MAMSEKLVVLSLVSFPPLFCYGSASATQGSLILPVGMGRLVQRLQPFRIKTKKKFYQTEAL